MKKLLSMCIACVMLVTFFVPSTFALNAQEAENHALQAVKNELDSLNNDADAEVSLRKNQRDIVEDAKAYFDSNIDAIDWDSLTQKIEDSLSTARDEEIQRYMTLRYFAYKYQGVLTQMPTLAAVVEELKELDIEKNLADIPVGEARNTLNSYIDAASDLYIKLESKLSSGTLTQEEIDVTEDLLEAEKDNINAYRKEEIKLSIKALMKVVFVSNSTEFETVYNALRGKSSSAVERKAADLRLKHIALYLKPFTDANISLSTIKTSAKEYAEANKSALKNEAKAIYTNNRSIEEAAEMSHDLLREVVYGAYNKYTTDIAQSYPDVYSWLEVFFGKEDGSDTGAIEWIMKEMDAEGKYQNVLVNLAVRKAIQMTLPGEKFVTESAATTDADRITVSDGDFASFIIDIDKDKIDKDKLDKINDALGVNIETITIPANLFNIVIECKEADYNDNVTYDKETGKFTVTRNSNLPATYKATVTVYRALVVGDAPVDSYIESYPIWIENPAAEQEGSSSSSSSSNNKYITIKLTENGSVVGPSVVKKGNDAQFEAVADAGYAVGEIFVDGKVITDFTRDGVNAKFTIKNITSNVTVDVKFIKLLNDKISYAYIKGYPEGDVRPNNNLTREEAAKIFYRILTKEAGDKFRKAENNYTDVSTDRWSNVAISTLSNIGILTGFPDGTFKPAQTITRAEFSTIVYRFYNTKYSGPDKFTDIAGHWAQASINAIAAKNWIKGYEDSTFGPNKNITRAEAVTIINRLLEREYDTEKFANSDCRFTDCCEEKWFYADIMEASTEVTE